MTMKKAALLTYAYAFTNPYESLPELSYSGNKHPGRKTQLTKKQKKKRLLLSLHVKLVGNNVVRLASSDMSISVLGYSSGGIGEFG